VGYWGCAGDLDNPERFGFLLDGAQNEIPNAPECVTSLFKMRCNSAACHGEGASRIDLVSSGIEDRVLDKPSTSEFCKDRMYVATDGSPSLLLEKFQAKPPCGVRMPIGDPLPESDVKCVSDWVKAVSDAKGGGS
jgi:hypothetical protein